MKLQSPLDLGIRHKPDGVFAKGPVRIHLESLQCILVNSSVALCQDLPSGLNSWSRIEIT